MYTISALVLDSFMVKWQGHFRIDFLWRYGRGDLKSHQILHFFKCWVPKLKFCVQVGMILMIDWWEYQKLFQLNAGSSGVTKIGPFQDFFWLGPTLGLSNFWFKPFSVIYNYFWMETCDLRLYLVKMGPMWPLVFIQGDPKNDQKIK